MTAEREGHRVPRIGVSAIVLRPGEVLLVERARPPYRGAWSLPGGLVEWGETLEQAARREVAEETGLDIAIEGLCRNLDLIGTDDATGSGHHFVLAVFHARPVGGALAAGDDAAAAAWTRLDALAGLTMTPGSADLIAEAAAHLTRL